MRLKRYKLINSIFIFLFFNCASAVLLNKSTSVEVYLFIQVMGLMLIAGFQVPFKSNIRLRKNTSILKGYLYALWIIIVLIVIIKVMSIGLPGQQYVGRAYEEAFMTNYSFLTKVYLFGPIISAAIIILEEKKRYKYMIFVVSSVLIFIPGVKGNFFLFLFVLIYYKLLETKKLGRIIVFMSMATPILTFLLFYVSHFVIRSNLNETSVFDTITIVGEKIFLYFKPNFQNLALTIEKSDIFQYGAVFMFPIVETLTLGSVRTTGTGQIWYFVDPNLKAGTFARDFWQDWGVFAPFFTFLLGLFYSWLSSLVYGDGKINKILISVLSFPFAFVFFYNEFSRNQIIFGFLLLIILVQNARRIRI